MITSHTFLFIVLFMKNIIKDTYLRNIYYAMFNIDIVSFPLDSVSAVKHHKTLDTVHE